MQVGQSLACFRWKRRHWDRGLREWPASMALVPLNYRRTPRISSAP